ncbi:MAG: AAA family ATPase, partial [Candidatus Caldarchaeum sp.]|nr:AAA family ATPase [Candidatus Caldarchaeum sp.]MDW8435779.1 AAA family ATPase [Candidatus Caldarchaeum sp.]
MAAKKVICIAGFAAVGKSTVGKIVAKKLRLKYVSGGDALKAVARDMGFKPGGPGWWETPKGIEFLSWRSRDPSFDKKVDNKLLEICRNGGYVVDSWVMPWLFKGKAFKVW